MNAFQYSMNIGVFVLNVDNSNKNEAVHRIAIHFGEKKSLLFDGKLYIMLKGFIETLSLRQESRY